MKKIIIFLIVLVIILMGIIFFVYIPKNNYFTGEAITEINQYSYTKAICNESNFCQDYQIICKGNELISQRPITGATIQHSFDWKDPRDKETIDELCNY